VVAAGEPVALECSSQPTAARVHAHIARAGAPSARHVVHAPLCARLVCSMSMKMSM
jgi:hypothetical protein